VNNFLKIFFNIKTVLPACFLLFITVLPAQAKMEKLVLAGPKASVTHPMAYMIEAGLLDDIASEVELRIWDNPDQLRSLIAGGQAHFAAVPSYVAAVFHNKGIPLRLLNISTWGILWMVSSDAAVHSIADLKGEEISMSSRNDMADLVFKSLALGQGLDPEKDFKLRYNTNQPTVVQDVLSRRTKHGILVEPLMTMALMKSEKMQPGAAKLFRAISVQEEWGKVYKREPKIPQGGICATPAITDNPEAVKKFQQAYKTAIEWCNKNPMKAGKLAAKYIPGLQAKPVGMALKNSGLQFVPVQEAKPELIHFFNVLKKIHPKKIGGKLPDDDLYWDEK